MTKECPNCHIIEGVREFLYGMPSEEPDSSKYVLGGCVLAEEMPDYRCIKCATDFFKKGDQYQSRFLSDGSGLNFQCKDCKDWIATLAEIDWHECQQKVSAWEGY